MRTVVLLVVLALPAVAVGQEAMTPETLAAVKAATVYLRVDEGAAVAAGSGFVARVDDTTVFVVTNHHVVTPEADDFPVRIPRPFGPPGMPFGPRMALRGGPVKITAVFGSGTKGERSFPAQVVAKDEKQDLAVLKVTGVKDPPAPLTVDPAVTVTELATVYSFGFPFGEQLTGGKNPAVTVGKASVSSLRLDDKGDLARVQVEGELNPGNSGGPIVNARGQLIGVAVAKVKDTRIGLAVATRLVPPMFRSRVTQVTFRHDHNAADKKALAVEADIAALEKPFKAIRLDYTLRGQKAADGQSVELTIKGDKATGTVKLADDPTPAGGLPFTWQLAVTDAAGETARLAPPELPTRTVWLNHPSPRPKPVTPEELPGVLDTLAGKNVSAQVRALERLAETKPEGATRDVIGAIKPLLMEGTFPTVRAGAVKVMAVWGGVDAVKAIVPLLDDKDTFTRNAAIDALTGTKDEAAITALAKKLEVQFDNGRAAAALKKCGPAAAKPVLPYLKGKDFWTKKYACEVLAEVGGPESVDALTEAARDENGLIRLEAERALKAVKGRK